MLATKERRERRRRGGPSDIEIGQQMQARFMDTSKASGPLRSRLFWTPEMDKIYMMLLVEHAGERGKEGSTFKRDAWQDMLSRFNEKADMNIDVDQLKNRLRFYRHQHRVVWTLRDLPEFSWDDKKQLVVADEACWSKFVTKNLAAKFYKHKPITCFRELEIIFGSSQDKTNRPCFGQDADAMEEDTIEGTDDGIEAIELSNLNIVSKDEINDPSNPSATSNATNLLTAQTPLQQPNVVNHRKRHRAYSSTTPNHADRVPLSKRQLDISERKVASVPASLGSDKFKTLDECMAEMDTMEGLDDELYVKALIILRDEYNRHVFLNTSGHRRLSWLRIVTRNVDV
ncbi:hypothetical protein J5N97_018094 [Dioscorea zingiberensis]|uniref:Myb/SANT-like domain-containing protein n=1 Tax=Dioscorea zingiberensis TaxID=325984 RepID=A0A9D5HGY7_9LILI|nr:hypothetical protein J5N97_018094 [Dioscorea zingiberensis]